MITWASLEGLALDPPRVDGGDSILARDIGVIEAAQAAGHVDASWDPLDLLVLLFGVSATYHVFRWPPRVKDWLRRADHATIFIFIAATYTPLVFNVLSGWWRIGVLAAVWISAIAGVAGAAPFLRIPRQVLASLYLAMGWVAVVALVPLTAALGWVAAVLMALGGLQYSLGAAAYAFKKPRLWPRVFGYHELFHLAVITASVTFYVIVVHYAVPYHRAG